MIKKKIIECNNGSVIGEDVFVEGFQLPIVRQNHLMSDHLREKLLSHNVEYVSITDPIPSQVETETQQFKRIYAQNTEQVKTVFNTIIRGDKMDSHLVISLTQSLMNQSTDVFKVLESMNAVRKVDEYTYTHSLNVGLYAMMLGKWMKLDNEEITRIITAGLLHDIGKSMIPASLLQKNGKLSEDEFTFVKKHSTYGYEICMKQDWLHPDIKTAVLHHHERQDGNGYPEGLKGSSISLYSKILSIADVYDALTSERPYKKRQTPFDTFKQIQSMGYDSFDPEVLQVFLSNISSVYIGTKVMMNTGCEGEIVFIPLTNITSPIVRIKEMLYDLSISKDLKIAAIL